MCNISTISLTKQYTSKQKVILDEYCRSREKTLRLISLLTQLKKTRKFAKNKQKSLSFSFFLRIMLYICRKNKA